MGVIYGHSLLHLGCLLSLAISKRNLVVTSQRIWYLPLSSAFVNSVFDILHNSTDNDCLP